MASAITHSKTKEGRPQYLDEFRELNPDLIEGQGRYRCRGLWDLLTARHREDPECCQRGAEGRNLRQCFTDHAEPWKDGLTGLPVIVAHPYCQHRSQEHNHDLQQKFFEERGLEYLVSTGSWYSEGTRLVVIARADVIDRITLPRDEDRQDDVVCPLPTRIDWEMREALKVAEEGVLRNRNAMLAPEAEEVGDYLTALRFYCDTAYTDRTGGFHKLAREQLDYAKRIITAHPDLDKTHLYFKNNRDRSYICGPSQPFLSRSGLNRLLRDMDLPPGWGPFRAQESGHAIARISGDGGSGAAWITQGGNLNMWSASVELNGQREISTPANGEPMGFSGEENFCCQDVASAVAAAVDICKRYDTLVGINC